MTVRSILPAPLRTPHRVATPLRRGAPLVAMVLACIAALSLVASALAQGVPRLSAQVTDETGVLSGASSVQSALNDLLGSRDVQLWIAFVHTTGNQTPSDFAQATFTQNGLGGNDALLVVAVDDHRYAWWEADNGPLRGIRDEVDGILSSSLDSRFRAGDYAGGVNDFARALRERLGGAAPPAAVTPAPGGTQQPAPAGGTSILGVIVAVILVLAGLLIIAGWWGRRRADRRTAEERDRRTGQLARDANALLIQTDDAVREAQQDADFVAAQFGDSEAAPYRDALATATAELKAAFGVRQKLDDSIPEDPETRERMLNEILTRARHAAALLDEQRRRAAELRESESKAPDVLAALPTAIDALAARLPTSQAAFARLGAYAPAAWAAVSGNGSEAEKRIASARADTERGTSLLATDRHAAAASTRSAQAAVAQANGLLDAIEKTAASLDETRRRLSAEIEAAAPDVERAKAAVAAGRVDPKAVSTVDEAQKLLAAARAEASADRPDVIAGYRQAQQANQLADSVLEGVRQAEERRAREAAALATAIHSAEVSIARASDYITARRNGVGREARTRLAEGQRHHDLALQLQNTDPARAVEEARLAERYADEAYRLASDDFDDFDQRGGWRRPRGGGDNVAGAILGGIILGNVLGGLGRGGGGWGGTPWGGGGGGFGGFGGGGHGGGGGWGGGGGGGHGGGGGW